MYTDNNTIPFGKIETLFLDVGGTLVTIDFGRVCEELNGVGIACDAGQLARAEASARPLVSRELAKVRPEETEQPETFEFYLRTIFEQYVRMDDGDLDAAELAQLLAPILKLPGQSNLLWSSLLPGILDSLKTLHDRGLRMAVVSNSDGSVERILAEQGLRPFFDLVVDSHILGMAKPDARIFQYALDVLDSNPRHTLHVGDMYFSDVMGAQRAGIHAVLLDPWDDWTDVDCMRLPSVPAVCARILEAKSDIHA